MRRCGNSRRCGVIRHLHCDRRFSYWHWCFNDLYFHRFYYFCCFYFYYCFHGLCFQRFYFNGWLCNDFYWLNNFLHVNAATTIVFDQLLGFFCFASCVLVAQDNLLSLST